MAGSARMVDVTATMSSWRENSTFTGTSYSLPMMARPNNISLEQYQLPSRMLHGEIDGLVIYCVDATTVAKWSATSIGRSRKPCSPR
jgi:hypothetical protein